MERTLDVDYLVVGAGAMGMAFVDALTSMADVSVAIVDRRHGAGGRWLDAYGFVRLHQASAFYGVASTLLGGGRIAERRPGTRPARTGQRSRSHRVLRPRAREADGAPDRSSSMAAASISAIDDSSHC